MNQSVARTPQFVTAPVDDSATPQTVKKVAALDAYLVQFNDADGKEGVRVCFHVPGSETVFVLRETTGPTRILSNATAWFRDQFNKILGARGTVNEVAPTGGENGVESF